MQSVPALSVAAPEMRSTHQNRRPECPRASWMWAGRSLIRVVTTCEHYAPPHARERTCERRQGLQRMHKVWRYALKDEASAMRARARWLPPGARRRSNPTELCRGSPGRRGGAHAAPARAPEGRPKSPRPSGRPSPKIPGETTPAAALSSSTGTCANKCRVTESRRCDAKSGSLRLHGCAPATPLAWRSHNT